MGAARTSRDLRDQLIANRDLQRTTGKAVRSPQTVRASKVRPSPSEFFATWGSVRPAETRPKAGPLGDAFLARLEAAEALPPSYRPKAAMKMISFSPEPASRMIGRSPAFISPYGFGTRPPYLTPDSRSPPNYARGSNDVQYKDSCLVPRAMENDARLWHRVPHESIQGLW